MSKMEYVVLISSMSKNVLVTGGAGFIGSHLVDRLINEGYTVRVLDNLSTGKLQNISGHLSAGTIELVQGDICDAELVKKTLRGINLVVHLAAVTQKACLSLLKIQISLLMLTFGEH